MSALFCCGVISRDPQLVGDFARHQVERDPEDATRVILGTRIRSENKIYTVLVVPCPEIIPKEVAS